MAEHFDVIVIGAGPGGYVAAIRAAQNGLKVACVDKRETLGGTCLNVGCIPSKALLHASHLYHEATHDFAKYGLDGAGVTFDFAKVMDAKEKAVSGLTDGVEFLFKKNKVTWLKGLASFKDAKTLTIAANDGSSSDVTADSIVIATGSEPSHLPGVEIDEESVVTSTGALALKKLPKSMVVIGGGVIGLEMGSVWSRFGTNVTVVEFVDQVLPGMDMEVRKTFGRILKKQGMTLELSSKVTGVEKVKGGVNVTYEPVKGGDAKTIKVDVVLVSVGRRPNTDGLNIEAAGLTLDDRGRVPVGHDFATSVPGIYAIGDVTVGPMLAHKAEDEGMAVADNLAGLTGYVNHDVIPNVVYTAPEVASVGKSEDELKADGIAYKAGKFPFSANSRAKTNQQPDGFVKVLADKDTDRVLGVHIIGLDAGNMIAQAATAMEFGASSEDIALTCHAHPTESEAMKEAAMSVTGLPLHM